MRTINEILSKEMRVEPLKEGETREFVLIRAGIFSPNTNKPAIPRGHLLPGQAPVVDPFDKITRTKLIQNVVAWDPITKPGEKTTFNPIIQPVNFPSTGRLIVTSDQPDLYAFLVRHPKNRDNPFRKYTGKDVVFFEVDDVRDAKAVRNNFKFETLASVILMGMDDDITRLVALASKVNSELVFGTRINLNLGVDQLTQALSMAIKTNARKFIMLSENEEGIISVMVDDLIKEGSIVFDEKKKEYFWSGNKKQAICKAVSKPEKDLVAFLISDEGSKEMALVRQSFERINSPVEL